MTAAVFDNRACQLGEGPLWHPQCQQVFWLDILGKRLMTRDARGARHWQFDRHVSAAGWIDRDTLLVATEIDLIRFDLTTGTQQRLCPLEADNRVTRSNDGRADPWGGFWIGTMGKQAEPQAGAIYRYYRGKPRLMVDKITIPNAICFSPDRSFMHFADSMRRTVWRQALDPVDGWPVGDPSVFLQHGADGPIPDGAVIDAAGVFWCAEWGSARVRGYAPDGGVVGEVALPASQPSCPAFGGTGLRDLYVTSAQMGLSAEALNSEPLAGQTFVMAGLEQGQAEHQVIL